MKCFEELENCLQVENFAESDPVNKQFKAFYEILHETIDKFAPAKKPLEKKSKFTLSLGYQKAF